MPRLISAAKRAEAIRLRVEQQLSAPAIARRVKISNFSAYKILKKYPWRGRTRLRTEWAVAEVAALIRLWPTAERAEIERALPRRTFESAGKKAGELKLRRPMPQFRRNRRRVHPVVERLEQIRRSRRITRPTLAKRARGLHPGNLAAWAMGKRDPHLKALAVWADVMGYDLMLQRKRIAGMTGENPPESGPPAAHRVTTNQGRNH